MSTATSIDLSICDGSGGGITGGERPDSRASPRLHHHEWMLRTDRIGNGLQTLL
jgi:hypothetical protein